MLGAVALIRFSQPDRVARGACMLWAS